MKNIFQHITSKRALAILLVIATFASCEKELEDELLSDTCEISPGLEFLGVVLNGAHQFFIVFPWIQGKFHITHYNKMQHLFLKAHVLRVLFELTVDGHELKTIRFQLPAHDVHGQVVQFLFC